MGITAKKELLKSKQIHIVLGMLFVCLAFMQPVGMVYRLKASFFQETYAANYPDYYKAYYTSQYVKKHNPGIIPDETLESFAAGIFLTGINPILIIHDQPPLGRYILALSILLFNNVNTIVLVLLGLSLVGLYLISLTVNKHKLIAFIPVAFFMNEPLFLNKFLYTPLLEPVQLPFIIFALYCYMKAVKSNHSLLWFLAAGVMVGFVISTRFFVLGAVLVCAVLLFFIMRKTFDKKYLLFFLTVPVSLIVLIASYWKTLESGYTVVQIFSIQKYIYTYHKSALILPFTFWDLLFFNRWHTWWSNYAISSDNQWNIVWPFSALCTVCFAIAGSIKKISLSDPEKILLLWVCSYSLLLSAGYTSTRYFLPLLPFLYIVAVRVMTIILSTVYKKIQ